MCGCKQFSIFHAGLFPRMLALSSSFLRLHVCIKRAEQPDGFVQMAQPTHLQFQQLQHCLRRPLTNVTLPSIGLELRRYLHFYTTNSARQSVCQDLHIVRLRSIWRKTHRKVKTSTHWKRRCGIGKINHVTYSHSHDCHSPARWLTQVVVGAVPTWLFSF